MNFENIADQVISAIELSGTDFSEVLKKKLEENGISIEEFRKLFE